MHKATQKNALIKKMHSKKKKKKTHKNAQSNSKKQNKKILYFEMNKNL